MAAPGLDLGPPELRERLRHLSQRMCAGLVERDEPARLLLLAALCGEHALLLGPPGTAKSELARRLRDCIADAAYFERLLTKFSVPEELYGPLSIKRLEQDEYHRLTEGYLPSASVAFLDEIFNANSAILNALLTLLNEREFDNGTERIATPLVSVVAASNLVPEGAELAALYDRFLFRYQVEPISDRGFELLLDQTPPQGPAVSEDCWRLTALQLEQIREQAHHIKLPDSIKMLLASLRKALVEKKLYVSDRRWTKIVHVLRVAALCDGRDRVSLVDCWLMAPCLWNRPEQAPIAEQLVRSALDAVLVDEPTRYQTIASAFEREIEADRDRREQVCSAQGQPLWYDESGAETTEPYPKTQRRNHKGELLFKAPDDMPTRGGKTDFTLEELWEDWFNARPDGLTKLEAWSHNPVNQVTVKEERARVEQPRRYAAEDVSGRRRQVEEVLEHVNDFGAAIEVLQSQSDHLFVSSPRSDQIREHVDAARTMAASVADRLGQVITQFDAFPTIEP